MTMKAGSKSKSSAAKSASKSTKPSKTAKPAKPAARASGMSRTMAKVAALAQVDDLLVRSGAKSAGAPRVAPMKEAPAEPPPPKAAAAAEPAARPKPPMPLPEVAPSRFERCLQRAERGEPGPIRIADLTLEPELVDKARSSGLVARYVKILSGNPNAQPGRPLVNILGTADHDLAFQLLTLHELVLAAQELGREQVQVSLVRMSPEEAKDFQARPPAPVEKIEKKDLSPKEIAEMGGFLEVAIADIERDENLRQELNHESPEFRNLMESIRTIGLQNPPVVEVRDAGGGKSRLVCVSGHRRLLALETLGKERVSCALKLFANDKHRALAGLAENINREDLHFLDKADGYGLLVQQGMSTGEIAALLDADVRTIGKYLRAASWDATVKRRVRDMGDKATTRFLLNMMAAGERTTAELHAMLDRFAAEGGSGRGKPSKGAELRRKLDEFYQLVGCASEQRHIVERALRYLGYLR